MKTKKKYTPACTMEQHAKILGIPVEEFTREGSPFKKLWDDAVREQNESAQDKYKF